jgi:3D (Asp-Asp-Asp) domain-containing protein
LRQAHRRDPVRHKFGRLAGVSDACKLTKGTKLPQLTSEAPGTLGVLDRTKYWKSRGFLLPSRPVSGRRAQSAAMLAVPSAVLVLISVSAAIAAGPGADATSLQGQANVLDARAHNALLDLYALDTRLHTAQAQLASLEAQAARLRAQQMLLAQQLSATRHTLAVSQQRLGDSLRTLYEQGDTDALAVVLGAQSLDDALTRLDDMTRIADQSRQVVEVTSAAQIRLARARSTFAAHRAQLSDALASARQTTNDLAAARSGRLAFIARLRSEQQLKARQISALQLTAQRVEAKSQKLQAAADAAAATAAPADPPSTPSSSVAPQPATPQPVAPSGGRSITVSATGYSLPGHTATGLPVGWGVVAVDPSVIPLGTRLTIPGYGEGVAADTGSGVRGATIDLWFPTLAQARAWGRRTVTVILH